MLKTKKVKLSSGEQITITELTVEDFMKILAESPVDMVLRMAEKAAGLLPHDLMKISLNDSAIIMAGFREVHSHFFGMAAGIARAIPAKEILTALIPLLVSSGSSGNPLSSWASTASHGVQSPGSE